MSDHPEISFSPVSWRPTVRGVDRAAMHPLALRIIETEMRVDLVSSPTGDRYAVRSGGNCLSVAGRWTLEPSPSNRDEHFLDQYRFPSLHAALEVATAAAIKIARRTPKEGFFQT